MIFNDFLVTILLLEDITPVRVFWFGVRDRDNDTEKKSWLFKQLSIVLAIMTFFIILYIIGVIANENDPGSEPRYFH